jgi:beta-1,4-mannosyl-glycoprotein beta-1,4-N-acetylglucosaminyltransferase
MKVYDCFCFFNELDILEIRLNELDPVVDVFVLVEATWTHQKKPKPLYYKDNKERFKKFHSKIRHIILHDRPNFFYGFRPPNAWDYERFQKDQIIRGLKDCEPDDLIILSDVDEIPKPDVLKRHRPVNGVHVFQQRIYHYYINCLEVDKNNRTNPSWWYGSVMVPFKEFTSAKKLRFLREVEKYKGSKILPDAGWHFTSMGGAKRIIEKLESFAHAEFNNADFKNEAKIMTLIESGQSVFGVDIECEFTEIDNSFPFYIQKNKERLKDHIFEPSTA